MSNVAHSFQFVGYKRWPCDGDDGADDDDDDGDDDDTMKTMTMNMLASDMICNVEVQKNKILKKHARLCRIVIVSAPRVAQ